MAEGQLRGHEPLRNQGLLAIKVGQQGVEQLGALLHAGFDAAPFIGGDQQRQRIELPGPVAPLRVGIDVIGDAILDDEPPCQFDAAARGFGPAVGNMLDQRLPVGADRPVAIEQFVVAL